VKVVAQAEQLPVISSHVVQFLGHVWHTPWESGNDSGGQF